MATLYFCNIFIIKDSGRSEALGRRGGNTPPCPQILGEGIEKAPLPPILGEGIENYPLPRILGKVLKIVEFRDRCRS